MKARMIFILLFTFTIIAYINVNPAPMGSQPNTESQIAILTQRVDKLEAAVRLLASEIDEIKEELSSTNLTQSSGSLQNLSKIRKVLVKGASKNSIRQLLGEPIRTDSGIFFEYWYYPDGRVVRFDTSNNTVDGWDGF